MSDVRYENLRTSGLYRPIQVLGVVITIVFTPSRSARTGLYRKRGSGPMTVLNPHHTCAVKRRWSTAGESPARELGSLHPEAIGATVEKTKPSEPPV